MTKTTTKRTPLDPLKFGIDTEAQWLLISPIRYEDYTCPINKFSDLVIGENVVLKGTIVSRKMFDKYNNITKENRYATRIHVVIEDRFGLSLQATEFGRPGFAWGEHEDGSEIVIRGVIGHFNGKSTIGSVKIVPQDYLNRVVPIYGAIKQTAGARFNEVINLNSHHINVAAAIIESEVGWHDPSSSIASHPMFSVYKSAVDLLDDLHDPLTMASGKFATESAAILSAYALTRKAKLRAHKKEANAKSIILISPDRIDRLIKGLPYPLTKDQARATQGIADALKSPYALDGILSGDVGSGKTISFLVPLVAAHESGAKCVIMAPNLLLIKQIANEIKSYFPHISVCTITGGKDGIDGDPDKSILVGTTALVSWYKKNKAAQRPHFIVIDEQQRFSVEQRSAMAEPYTNILEATATPIPRTAALAIYGDKSLFLLKEIPVVKKIDTVVVSPKDADEIDKLFLEIIHETNEQAAIVYPLVSATNGNEDEDTCVINAAKIWGNKIDPSLITVLHGKLSDNDKMRAIDEFKSGKTKLLIASIVIEVGLTVPDLKTLMVIGSDKMGLVTLHQLRGRLARHGGEGLMLLHVENTMSDSMSRLQILVDHQDGFTVSEKDAEQRGFGDFLSADGDAQSGKTRTLFMGVKIGPVEIDNISRLLEVTQKKSQETTLQKSARLR